MNDRCGGGRRLPPREASKYLKDVHGVDLQPSTMAKKRCLGGGPEFRKIGGHYVSYDTDALDRYAERIISPPLTSTSDRAA